VVGTGRRAEADLHIDAVGVVHVPRQHLVAPRIAVSDNGMTVSLPDGRRHTVKNTVTKDRMQEDIVGCC
jgi:hypothetical protein